MSTSEQMLGVSECAFPVDQTSAEELRGYFEAGFAPRIFNPLEDEAASSSLLALRAQWRDEQATVVFTSGVFDVMHANHRSYLLATLLSAVPTHFTRREAHGDVRVWNDLDSGVQQKYRAEALSTGQIRQIVSVDGNRAVAERKGFREDKANMDRPLYDWKSRARDVLSASILVPGSPRLLVDAVTVHDKVEPSLASGPHIDILDIGFALEPDVWAIYRESQNIIDGISEDRRGPGRSNTIYPVIIENSEALYSDSQLGGPFSTTALAQRIGSISAKQIA